MKLKNVLLGSLFFICILPELYAQNSDFSKNLKKLNNTPNKQHAPTKYSNNKSVPVDNPWLYFGSFPYMTPSGVISTSGYIQDRKHDTALLNSLCAWQETTTVLDLNNSVSFQIPVINAKENGEKYCVIYEFKKFTNIDSANVRFDVGIVIRLVAKFTTLKGSVNLSLSGLGLEAAAGKLSGTISLSCFGASLPKIGAAFTTTSSITIETIEKILQQVATLKSTIYDPSSVISPYVIGIQSLDSTQSEGWEELQKKAVQSRASFKAGSN